MYLRFWPFGALVPNSFIISLAKIRLSYFAFEHNDRGMRTRVQTELTEYFNSIGIHHINIVCNASNNDKKILDKNELVVDMIFQVTPFHSIKHYKIVMGPRPWDNYTASYFDSNQLTRLFCSQVFEVVDLSP